MKRILYPVFSIASLLPFTGCDDGNAFDGSAIPSLKPEYLALESSQLEVDAEDGSSATLAVSSSGTPWSFHGYADWLGVSPSTGNSDVSVVMTALSSNLSGDDIRTSIFQFGSTDPEYALGTQISVTQKAARPYIEVSESTLNFKGSASSLTISVASNIVWSLGYVKESWLNVTFSDDNRQLIVSVTENLTGYPRNASICLKGKAETIILINQALPVINEIETQSLRFPADGAGYELSFTSETAWKAVSTAPYWLTVSPGNGTAGQNKIVVSAVPNASVNEQSGNIQLMVGDNVAYTIPCSQEALYVTVEQQNLQFRAEGGSETLNLESNATWSLIEKPDWICVSPDQGSGNGKITLTATENWSLQQRTGTLRIGQSSIIGLVAEVDIVQQGRTFDDLVALLQFDDDASSRTFDITTDGKWTVSSTEQWISVDKASGTGNATITVSVTENMTELERNAQILVTVYDQTKTVAVVQAPKYFVVSPQDASLPSTGGSHSVHVATNDSWTASTPSSWITLSAASGTGDVDLLITAADNPSITPRTDTTTINPAYNKPIKVVTSQDARYLRVSESSINFFKEGGDSRPVVVETDGTFDVSIGDASEWLSVRRSGNSFTLTADANESGTKRQANVKVSLKGLNDDESYSVEIAVSQNFKDGIDVISFESDQMWDINTSYGVNISVTGFSADQLWDDTIGSDGAIEINGLGEDNNRKE